MGQIALFVASFAITAIGTALQAAAAEKKQKRLQSISDEMTASKKAQRDLLNQTQNEKIQASRRREQAKRANAVSTRGGSAETGAFDVQTSSLDSAASGAIGRRAKLDEFGDQQDALQSQFNTEKASGPGAATQILSAGLDVAGSVGMDASKNTRLDDVPGILF